MTPFAFCSGPRDARLMLIGEAPGEAEFNSGCPFVGASGFVLDQLLATAGVRRQDVFITNVLTEQPPRNNIEALLVSRTEGLADLGPVVNRKYFPPRLLPELARLRAEIEAVNPRVIVCLGGVALWAVLQRSGISLHRGVVIPHGGRAVIGTFHPAAVARDYSQFVVAAADLAKALKYLDGRPVHVRARRFLLNPTLAELQEATESYLADPAETAVDLETKARQITCVGFGREDSAFVFPFWDGERAEGYFSPEEEVRAWGLVQRLLLSPLPKVFQNGLYDIQYLWYVMSMRVAPPIEDTMLMAHAMQPELAKGLGFLASLYLDEPAWKDMRKDFSRAKDFLKKDS